MHHIKLKLWFTLLGVGFALLVFKIGSAPAQPLKSNAIYTVSGNINIIDYEKFKNALSSNNIRTVRFENCFGGNALAGFRFAEAIKRAKLATVASGVVASSCAFAFLGGTTRKLDDKPPGTVIAYHGSFNAQSLKPRGREANQELLDIYEKNIGFRFSKTVQEIILNTTAIDEGVYFYSARIGAGIASAAYYCNGKLPHTTSSCVVLDGVTLESQGILKD